MSFKSSEFAGCKWLISSILLGVAGCCVGVWGCVRTIDIDSNEFTYEKNGPIELIAYLQRQSGNYCPTVAVGDAPESWLQKSDVEALMPLLWSEKTSANVHSIYSSFRDCLPSTVGREAAFLIQGFRKGKYPPEMNSGNGAYNREEIARWWGGYQEKQ